MPSFLSRIFSVFSGTPGSQDQAPPLADTVEYAGLTIQPAPEQADGQWRLAGVIIKSTDGEPLERTFLRADLFMSREDAETFAIRKAKQIIDERGDQLFADGEKTGRA